MDFLRARAPSSNGILERYTAVVTDSYVLKSETDVVGAATVHILHDINAVLNDGLQNGSIKWNTSGPRATKLALTSDGPPITARASLRYWLGAKGPRPHRRAF